jgi:hypothetical protein
VIAKGEFQALTNLGGNKLIAIAVIPVIAVSVVLGVYFGTSLISPNSVTVNSTSVNSRTSSRTTASRPSTSTISDNSSGNYLKFLETAAQRYALNGTWSFSVMSYLNGTTLFINSTLVYLGNTTGKYQKFGGPIGAVTLTAPNGTVSDWTGIVPDYVSLENVTFGRNFTSRASIPAVMLASTPGNYTVNVQPRISTDNGTSLGPLLAVNLTIASVPSYSYKTTTTTSANPSIWNNETTSGNYTINPLATTTIFLNQTDGSSACQSLGATASWSASDDTCVMTGASQVSLTFLVFARVILMISPGVSLILENSGSEFVNYGTIINNGTIDILNTFIQYGVLINHGTIWTNVSITDMIDTTLMPNGGTTSNYGDINIFGYYKSGLPYGNATTYANGSSYFLSGGSYRNGGILNNYGTINSTGDLQNFALDYNSSDTINNYGTIINGAGGLYENLFPSNVLNNFGAIVNEGNFVNNGTFYAYCPSSTFKTFGSGTFSGNPIISPLCTTTTVIGTVATTSSDNESDSVEP